MRHLARQRDEVRRYVAAFLLVNAFVWAIWALTEDDKGGVPWPVWVTVSWGFLLAWRMAGASFALGSRRRDGGREEDRDGHD